MGSGLPGARRGRPDVQLGGGQGSPPGHPVSPVLAGAEVGVWLRAPPGSPQAPGAAGSLLGAPSLPQDPQGV